MVYVSFPQTNEWISGVFVDHYKSLMRWEKFDHDVYPVLCSLGKKLESRGINEDVAFAWAIHALARHYSQNPLKPVGELVRKDISSRAQAKAEEGYRDNFLNWVNAQEEFVHDIDLPDITSTLDD